MKTKAIPTIVMLIAGGIRCVYGILYREQITTFLLSLALIMLLFYTIGAIVKYVIDKNFAMLSDDAMLMQVQDKILENIEGNKEGASGDSEQVAAEDGTAEGGVYENSEAEMNMNSDEDNM